jgi:phage tail sheath gpL-like
MLNPSATLTGTPATLADGPFFTTVTLRLNGTVRQGDVWQLGLRYRDYSYTADADDDLRDVADALAALLPARFTVSVTGDQTTGVYVLSPTRRAST